MHEFKQREKKDRNKKFSMKGLGLLWGKIKERRSERSIRRLVKGLVAAALSTGLVLGTAGYIKATAAQGDLDNLDLGIEGYFIPTPQDLTEAVNSVQEVADSAQAYAMAAQNSANIALGAVPRLVTMTSFDVPVGTPTLGPVVSIPAGTYVIEWGVTVPLGHTYAITLVLSDGRDIPSIGTASGFRTSRAIMTVGPNVTARIQGTVSGGTGSATFSQPYVLLTTLQRG